MPSVTLSVTVDDAAAGVDVANDDAGDRHADILRRHQRRVGMIDGDVVEIGGEARRLAIVEDDVVAAADIAARRVTVAVLARSSSWVKVAVTLVPSSTIAKL